MSETRLAQQAQSGFAAASAYDVHRPSYPPEAVSQLLSALNIAGIEGATVADLAAGTGKFTELLAARPEKYNIIGIEPHDGMRAELERKHLNGLTVLNGSADSMPDIPDESVDALIAAQSFHWFANISALKEIHRVLKPTGVFGVIWNIEDYNAPRSWEMSSSWETTIHNLTWSFDNSQPRFRHEKWKRVFEDQLKSSPFSITSADPLFSLPLGEGTVKFETWLPKEDIWKRYRTLSQIAILEGEELEKVKKTFFEAINRDDVDVDEHGRVAIHGHTFFAWSTRVPGEPLRSGG